MSYFLIRPFLYPYILIIVFYFPRSPQRCRTCRHKSSNCRRSHGDHQDTFKCALCKTNHALRFCRKFLRMSVKKREEVVDRHNYCVNCLAKSHNLRSCTSMATCRKCDRFHHTLLHPGCSRSSRSQGIKTKDLRNRQHRRHKSKRKAEPSNTTPPVSTPQTTASTTPDTRLIVDAIRSLANVLCASNNQELPEGKAGAMSK